MEDIIRLVEVVAKSLVECLLVQPEVDALQDSSMMAKLETSYDHSSLVSVIQERLEGSSSSIANEIVKKAKERAIELLPGRIAEQEAEAREASKPNAASIFLSQLNGGGGLLDGFITWEMIREEETTNEGKIDRLKMIQYVDDILPDWDNDLRPFLSQFETLSVCSLYRTWFGKARVTNTPESQAFQRDLTTDLFQLSVSSTSSQEVSRTSFQYAIKMFIDLADRSIPDCYHVGKLIWHILLANPRELGGWLANLDPYATSFSLWFSANEMTVDTTVELLAGTSCCSEDFQTDISILLELAFSLDASAQPKRFYFALGVLHSIINCTRVTQFPWDMAGNKDSADIFGLFLSGALASKDMRHFSVCVDALDTLERGTQDKIQRLGCRDQYRIAVDRLLEASAFHSKIKKSVSTILDRLDRMG